MAEKIRPKPTDEAEKQKQKAEKLKKLQELQSQLDKLDKKNSSEVAEKQSQVAQKQIDTLDEELNSVEAEIQKQVKTVVPTTVKDKEIDSEILALEKELESEKVSEQVKSVYEKLIEMHPWLGQPQYGFMYTAPSPKKNKKEFDSWQEEWSQVLLDYARVAILHVLYPKNLLTEKPFNQFQDRAKSIAFLTEALVQKKIAEWLDRKKEALRIYWKSMEEWSGLIVDWAHDNGKTDPIIMPEIRSSGEEFANLPDQDLRKIFKIIEKQGKGMVVPMEQGEVALKVN
jgi:hypothetical protein